LGWFSHDVMDLAGPPLSVRQELFDFIVSELQQREDKQYSAIRKLRKGNFSKSAVSPRAIAWALGKAVYVLQT